MDRHSMVLFGSRPVLSTASGDARGCPKKVLAISTQRAVSDNVFGMRLKSGCLVMAAEPGETFHHECQTSTGTLRQKSIRRRQEGVSPVERLRGGGMAFGS
jgi:hypothetical protein